MSAKGAERKFKTISLDGPMIEAEGIIFVESDNRYRRDKHPSVLELGRLLRTYLDDLGFSHEYRDPMYQLFIQEMVKARSRPLNETMTLDELQAQEALAQDVVTRLVNRERTDDLSALAQELKKLVG